MDVITCNSPVFWPSLLSSATVIMSSLAYAQRFVKSGPIVLFFSILQGRDR